MAAQPDTATAGGDLGYAWRALAVVGLAASLTSLNQNALNIALPVVVRHFEASSSQASQIIVVFAAIATGVMLGCGRASDIFGRKAMYVLGLGVFTSGSLLCGAAPSYEVLMIGRIMQAVSHAMLLANGATIVSAAFPAEHLRRGIGAYTACFSVAGLLGPSVGGALATAFGWRWVFWFNVPVGLVALPAAILILRSNPRVRGRSLDPPGNIILLIAMGSLVLSMAQISGTARVDPAVAGGLALSLAAFAAFVLWERLARDPLLSLGPFRRLPFTTAVVAQFLNSMANFAILVLVGLYFQAARGMTPLEAGLAVLPLPAANALASIIGPILTRRLSARTVCVLGSAISTAGLVALLAATATLSGFWAIAAGLILAGVGVGLFQPANITAMLTGVPSGDLGATNALRLAIQNTANVLGTAVALMLLTAAVPAFLRSAVVSGTVSEVGAAAVRDMRPGLILAFGVLAALSALAIVASLAGRRVDQREQQDAAPVQASEPA